MGCTISRGKIKTNDKMDEILGNNVPVAFMGSNTQREYIEDKN